MDVLVLNKFLESSPKLAVVANIFLGAIKSGLDPETPEGLLNMSLEVFGLVGIDVEGGSPICGTGGIPYRPSGVPKKMVPIVILVMRFLPLSQWAK